MSTDVLTQAEEMIRSGLLKDASELLLKLDRKDFRRPEQTTYAKLLRRSGHTEQALAVLRPYVRPKTKEPETATPDEAVEYAVGLIKLGATNEGLQLLAPISGQDYPDKFLYSAFAHISNWNYQEAAQFLEKYTALTSIAPYSRLVAKVNLLSCYVFEEQTDQALTLCEEVLALTGDRSFNKLRTSALRYAAQLHLALRDFEKAASVLTEAFEGIDQKTGVDSILADKWKWVLMLKKYGPSPQCEATLQDLRQRAQGLELYEVIRDLDYYEALHFENDAKLLHVYFGTPYPSFREKVARAYKDLRGRELALPDSYRRTLLPLNSGLEPASASGRSFINLENGINSFGGAYLRPGLLQQKLLKLMAADFYRPLGMHKIHNDLFEEIFFNPLSTPNKIHQLTSRFNAWLSENNIPLKLESNRSFYTIRASEPIDLVLEGPKAQDPALLRFLASLKSHFGPAYFGVVEGAQAAQLPRRTFSAHLRECVLSGQVQKQGAGPKTKYRVSQG